MIQHNRLRRPASSLPSWQRVLTASRLSTSLRHFALGVLNDVQSSGGVKVRDNFYAVTIDFEGHVLSRQSILLCESTVNFLKILVDFGLPELICRSSERHIFLA